MKLAPHIYVHVLHIPRDDVGRTPASCSHDREQLYTIDRELLCRTYPERMARDALDRFGIQSRVPRQLLEYAGDGEGVEVAGDRVAAVDGAEERAVVDLGSCHPFAESVEAEG